MLTLNWGIAGTSKISHDFHSAIIADYTDQHHKVLAIASRSKRRADLFAKEHGIDEVFDNYLDIANHENIEVVYIGTSSFLHHKVCEIMLTAGKHVLCEVPIGLTSQETDELLRLAKSRNVLLLTGLWSRFFPAYCFIDDLLVTNRLGIVKDVYVKMGRKIEDKNKIIDRKLAGGVTYCEIYTALQFVFFIYREFPKSIRASGKINQFGIDMFVEVDLKYSNRRTAKLVCSGIENIDSQANVIGNRGVIIIPEFESPTKISFGTHKKEYWPLFKAKTQFFFKNTQGLRYEADEVGKLIRKGCVYSRAVPYQDMMDIAKVVDEIRKQLKIQL